jgi:hypothetical protein
VVPDYPVVSSADPVDSNSAVVHWVERSRHK